MLWTSVLGCFPGYIYTWHVLYGLTNIRWYTLLSSLPGRFLKIVSEVGTSPEWPGHGMPPCLACQLWSVVLRHLGPSCPWGGLGLLSLLQGPLAHTPASAPPRGLEDFLTPPPPDCNCRFQQGTHLSLSSHSSWMQRRKRGPMAETAPLVTLLPQEVLFSLGGLDSTRGAELA